MDTRLKKYIPKIITFTVLLAIVGTVLFSTVIQQYYFKTFPFIFIIFITVSIIVHSIMLKADKKTPIKFNTAFMLGFIIKLFTYIIYSGIILYFDKTNIKSFIITIMTLYICYTIFNIKQILTDVKSG